MTLESLLRELHSAGDTDGAILKLQPSYSDQCMGLCRGESLRFITEGARSFHMRPLRFAKSIFIGDNR